MGLSQWEFGLLKANKKNRHTEKYIFQNKFTQSILNRLLY